MNVQHSQALIRISLGVVLLAHGFLLKVQTFGVAGTVGFFESIGLPAIAAYAVILGETLGGLALVFGVLSRRAAGLSLPILLGATYMHWGNGWLFSNANGGWEFPVILVVMAAGVVLGGAGSFALENHSGVQKRLPWVQKFA